MPLASDSPNRPLSRRIILGAIASSRYILFAQGPRDTRQLAPSVLSGFGVASRQSLLTIVSGRNFRGQIPAASVRELMRAEGKNSEALMLSLLPLAQAGAHPPLSSFFAAAVVQGSTGNLYLGANIEIPGQALGLTVHAEQAAIANAYMQGEDSIVSISVGEAPCGYCRQFLAEVSLDGNLRVLIKDKPSMKLSALLPLPFGPADLGAKQGAFPIRKTSLSVSTTSQDAQITSALDAARKSYAPYTKSASGVSIVTSEQRMFSGSYIENAAFNPSLPPLETALAGLYAAGVNAASIVRAVLVEMEGAPISQSSVTKAALSSLAPAAKLEIFLARRSR